MYLIKLLIYCSCPWQSLHIWTHYILYNAQSHS